MINIIETICRIVLAIGMVVMALGGVITLAALVLSPFIKISK
jgi:hypothetical protein